MTSLRKVLVLALVFVSSIGYSQSTDGKGEIVSLEKGELSMTESLDENEKVRPATDSQKKEKSDISITIYIREYRTLTLKIQRKIQSI